MSPVSAKSEKHAPADEKSSKADGSLPFAMMYRSELWWAPVQAAAKMLLQSQENIAAMMQINRKLADDLREIVRREQDLVLDLSEKTAHRAAEGTGKLGETGAVAPETFEQLYETAIAGVREFSHAVADAQAHSIEAFQEHARATVEAAKRSEHKTAA